MDNRTRDKGAPSRVAGLALACSLAIALLAISYGRLAWDLSRTGVSAGIVQSTLAEPIWRTRLGLNIALFALVMVALHLAFGLLCWLLARISQHVFPRVRCTRRHWILLWYLAGVAWILVANATYFPSSSLGSHYGDLVEFRIFGISAVGLITLTLAAAIATVGALALRRLPARQVAWASVGAASLLAAAGLLTAVPGSGSNRSGPPHIIVLGIDSLRTDAIDATSTPNLHAFMSGAVQWTDAVTPLARTFPSWASILTGRHPHTTGAHMNLLPRNLIRTGATLPAVLREHGYRTNYAIDETRFSNIDASYGFDQVISPTIGASDFLLASIADTPLSNLVVNTRLGALLFPHVHANRAASVVYDPDSFVRRIQRRVDFRQPSFLAVHLTLPHWPFRWATADNGSREPSQEELYRQSVRRADQQFGDLLGVLKRKGALGNALVIVLSDHGEALGHEDDFVAEAFPSTDREVTEFQRWGHGTSVFSPSQYRVVLGLRAYGNISPHLAAATMRHEPVSLMDLAPTILDLLHIEPNERFDGLSLLPVLASEDTAQGFNERIRFTESEYNPQGFDPRRFTTSQLAAAARVYQLDPATDRITVRTDMLESIMASRQYAALLGSRAMAAAIPGLRKDGKYEFIYVPDARPEIRHDPADSERLRVALERRFNIDIADVHEPPSAPAGLDGSSSQVTARRNSSWTSEDLLAQGARLPTAVGPSVVR